MVWYLGATNARYVAMYETESNDGNTYIVIEVPMKFQVGDQVLSLSRPLLHRSRCLDTEVDA